MVRFPLIKGKNITAVRLPIVILKNKNIPARVSTTGMLFRF